MTGRPAIDVGTIEAIFRYPVDLRRRRGRGGRRVVRANGNRAGIYGTVTRAGRLAVGQTVVLLEAS